MKWLIHPNNLEYRINLYCIIYNVTSLSTGLVSCSLLMRLFSNPLSNTKISSQYKSPINNICAIFANDNNLLKNIEKLSIPKNYNDTDLHSYIGIDKYDLCNEFENSLKRYYNKIKDNVSDKINIPSNDIREITDMNVYKYIF